MIWTIGPVWQGLRLLNWKLRKAPEIRTDFLRESRGMDRTVVYRSSTMRDMSMVYTIKCTMPSPGNQT